jgi:hypothetical protein
MRIPRNITLLRQRVRQAIKAGAVDANLIREASAAVEHGRMPEAARDDLLADLREMEAIYKKGVRDGEQTA